MPFSSQGSYTHARGHAGRRRRNKTRWQASKHAQVSQTGVNVDKHDRKRRNVSKQAQEIARWESKKAEYGRKRDRRAHVNTQAQEELTRRPASKHIRDSQEDMRTGKPHGRRKGRVHMKEKHKKTFCCPPRLEASRIYSPSPFPFLFPSPTQSSCQSILHRLFTTFTNLFFLSNYSHLLANSCSLCLLFAHFFFFPHLFPLPIYPHQPFIILTHFFSCPFTLHNYSFVFPHLYPFFYPHLRVLIHTFMHLLFSFVFCLLLSSLFGKRGEGGGIRHGRE